MLVEFSLASTRSPISPAGLSTFHPSPSRRTAWAKPVAQVGSFSASATQAKRHRSMRARRAHHRWSPFSLCGQGRSDDGAYAMSGGHERAAITARRSELELAFNTGDLELFDSLITDDVIWATASRPAWVGRAEVRDNIGRFFDDYEYELRFETAQLDTGGTSAVDRTNFESRVLTTTTTAAVSPEPHRGSVVMVWERDDEWRVAAYLDLGAKLFT